MWSRFKTLDPWLFVIPIMLMIVSVVMIYSLDPSSNLYKRQAIFAVAGLLCLGFAAFINYRSLQAWAGWIYGAGLLAMLAVRLVGTSEFGAKLWINVGFFQFEPGEIMKIVAMIMVASLLSRRTVATTRQFFLAAAAGALPFLVVLAQPDLGTALIILAMVVGMLLYANVRPWQRWLVVGVLLLGVGIIILSFNNVSPFTKLLKTYQKDRLVSFINPKMDPQGTGYNVIQSVIAVGSGGLTGQGLGDGSQSQLNFLPVAQADFIFAVIAETWGLIGSWGVLILYLILILRIIQAGRIAKDQFGALICVAVAAKLTFEVMVGIGMNIRLMPVTGIPLPFLSYGGTTMLTNAIAIGLVQSVALRYKRLTFE